jgi:glycine dehydrogenase subunit 1
MDYIPVTEQEKQQMLEKIGVKDASELFNAIPEKAKLKGLNLPEGMSEQKLVKHFSKLANKNLSLNASLNFLGAGIYEHFVPSLVAEIANRAEFSTAYTPYQPEASQGTLQCIFEYQSLVTQLTGLPVTNASLYDGASAVAESALLTTRCTGRKKVLVSDALHPEYFQVLKTYLQGTSAEIIRLPLENGETSVSKTKEMLDDGVAGIIIQSPNFLGIIEDLSKFSAISKPNGSLLVCVANPLSLGLLKSPGEAGVDVAVGEGQVLGCSSGFGGFAFGFMSAKKEYSWKMPGRIVGQTTDVDGKRGFVLTLQAREQHIKREKATSNICTNSALNALAACVFLSGWGPEGLKQLAESNVRNSHYAFNQITKIPGFYPAFKGQAFFNEFAVKTNKDVKAIHKKLLENKIVGPLELGRFYPELSNGLLFCVTETKSKEDIDKLVKILKEA